MMDRRRFLLTSLAGAFVVPLAVGAQPAGKVWRIALLFTLLPSTFPDRWAFYERLREIGWVYGRHYVAEHRVYEGDYNRVPGLVAELLR